MGGCLYVSEYCKITLIKFQCVGWNKTTQACPERVEGRSEWWRFRRTHTVCRKRLFSLVLEKPYSGLRCFRL